MVVECSCFCAVESQSSSNIKAFLYLTLLELSTRKIPFTPFPSEKFLVLRFKRCCCCFHYVLEKSSSFVLKEVTFINQSQDIFNHNSPHSCALN